LPIPDARFIVIPQDGVRRTGVTDRDGGARIEGLDPGVCIVSFPDLDATAWEPLDPDAA
jgi:hypothetical protein